MEFFSPEAFELHFHSGPVPVTPRGSEQLHVSHMIQPGHPKVPINTSAQRQYAAASNIAGGDAALGCQPMLRTLLQGEPLVHAPAHQNVQSPSRSAACGFAPDNCNNLSGIRVTASMRSEAVQQRNVSCGGVLEQAGDGLSACNVRAKQVKRKIIAAPRRTPTPPIPRTPKRLHCMFCPKVYVREVYFLSHIKHHLETIPTSGVNARNACWDAAAARPSSVVFNYEIGPSSTAPVASPIATNFSSPAVGGCFADLQVASNQESPLELDEIDSSKLLRFTTEEDQQSFDLQCVLTIEDIVDPHIGS
ncbi:hypothetical protein IscW_ISCW023548 [Ixodes scapularis]|uniref:C2H2-type domain-containing protein n=1 Tax=Ixodes scapularis TaxID=6945 RepID=B7QIW3_IXOSC|nr:hypothetical protein IscW_ISCW023548 [Ixodes scapularis]|eukprot:XP_002415120.1 hypothetical protein IscW_ISCW023548 [Ixodes scapularis]